MAKKRIIQRKRKRQKLNKQYHLMRSNIKMNSRKRESLHNQLQSNIDLQKIPRNSAPSRDRNICQLSGRPRGYFQDFGLSRQFLRELAHQGFLPGVRKSSWLLH